MTQDYVLLNGRSFKVLNNLKSGKYMLENIENPCKGYSTIWDAYNRPSTIKKSIWKDWIEWFNDTFISGEMVVSSRNSNFFSICFKGYTKTRIYRGYITATRNEVVYVDR